MTKNSGTVYQWIIQWSGSKFSRVSASQLQLYYLREAQEEIPEAVEDWLALNLAFFQWS